MNYFRLLSALGRKGFVVQSDFNQTKKRLNMYLDFERALNLNVQCKEHGVKQIQVFWARERSRFTLLFEAMIMALVDEMPDKS